MQEWHNLIPLLTFVFTTSITPGPNNIMLAASGVNYGLIRTTPHIIGIIIGLNVMLFAVGVGVGTLFIQWPILQTLLKYLGTIYLIYFAWKIAKASPPKTNDSNQEESKPFTILQAATFQVINFKSWIMAITSITAFSLPINEFFNVFLIIFLYTVLGVPCITLWAYFGMSIRNTLKNDSALQIFNLVMAALTILSVILLYIPLGCPTPIS